VRHYRCMRTHSKSSKQLPEKHSLIGRGDIDR